MAGAAGGSTHYGLFRQAFPRFVVQVLLRVVEADERLWHPNQGPEAEQQGGADQVGGSVSGSERRWPDNAR